MCSSSRSSSSSRMGGLVGTLYFNDRESNKEKLIYRRRVRRIPIRRKKERNDAWHCQTMCTWSGIIMVVGEDVYLRLYPASSWRRRLRKDCVSVNRETRPLPEME